MECTKLGYPTEIKLVSSLAKVLRKYTSAQAMQRNSLGDHKEGF